MNSQRFALQYINPLDNLTESRLAGIFNEAERGGFAQLQWLFRFVEKRNPTARAVKHRLLSALGKLQWDIKTTDCGKDPAKQELAEAQAETLRAAYDRVSNLRSALTFLALANLRGFSHLEKIYAKPGGLEPEAWEITELRCVDQWFWVRDGLYGAWEYNADAKVGAYRGQPVDLSRFILREVGDPAGEVIAKLHVRQEVSDADWDGYLDDFGIPAIILEGPPNVPPDKEAEYQRTAERIASAARGYIPNGAKAHMLSSGAGASVHKERLEYLDGQIVIAGTSGKLTILSESGSGTLAGGAQADAFDDIAQSIAMEISEAMQKGFDKEILERAFPEADVLAYFEFAAVNEKDGSKALGDAKLAKDAGFAIDEAELSEKAGWNLKTLEQNSITQPRTVEAPGAQTGATPPALQESLPVQAPKPEQPPVIPASQEAAEGALAKRLRMTPEAIAPARDVIADLIAKAEDGTISTEELLASAEEMLAALPELAARIDFGGVAMAMQEALAAGVEKTLTGAAK